MTKHSKTLYAMVTTRMSEHYTNPALQSFIATTPYREEDNFILIDNDASWNLHFQQMPPRSLVITNREPRGFAANMNLAIDRAVAAESDLIFLNNDLIFTSRWAEPLLEVPNTVVSPLSNRELTYKTETFSTGVVMSLEDYVGREALLEAIVQSHQASTSGLLRVFTAPFFAIRLPLSVLKAVGYADESFGRGGGEDYDYCLRAILAGFSVAYARQSYLLHFGGKSSYSGGETKEQQLQRERVFKTRFREKWGESLFSLCLTDTFDATNYSQAIQRGDYRGVVSSLCPAETPAIQIPISRQSDGE